MTFLTIEQARDAINERVPTIYVRTFYGAGGWSVKIDDARKVTLAEYGPFEEDSVIAYLSGVFDSLRYISPSRKRKPAARSI